MSTGRGAWTNVGMPTSSMYYELLKPTNVGSQPQLDDAHRAVMYGVKAIQTRINELGAVPKLVTDGWFGPVTGAAALWVQKKVGVVADGQIGPHTTVAMFWPVIKAIAGLNAHTVGGICAHESGFDPGAVGELDADDIGLVQINGPANVGFSEARRFDYAIAFKYASDRIKSALSTYQSKPWGLQASICSYASPLWGEQWFTTGKAPNVAMQNYVNFVMGWVAPG